MKDYEVELWRTKYYKTVVKAENEEEAKTKMLQEVKANSASLYETDLTDMDDFTVTVIKDYDDREPFELMNDMFKKHFG